MATATEEAPCRRRVAFATPVLELPSPCTTSSTHSSPRLRRLSLSPPRSDERTDKAAHKPQTPPRTWMNVAPSASSSSLAVDEAHEHVGVPLSIARDEDDEVSRCSSRRHSSRTTMKRGGANVLAACATVLPPSAHSSTHLSMARPHSLGYSYRWTTTNTITNSITNNSSNTWLMDSPSPRKPTSSPSASSSSAGVTPLASAPQTTTAAAAATGAGTTPTPTPAPPRTTRATTTTAAVATTTCSGTSAAMPATSRTTTADTGANISVGEYLRMLHGMQQPADLRRELVALNDALSQAGEEQEQQQQQHAHTATSSSSSSSPGMTAWTHISAEAALTLLANRSWARQHAIAPLLIQELQQLLEHTKPMRTSSSSSSSRTHDDVELCDRVELLLGALAGLGVFAMEAWPILTSALQQEHADDDDDACSSLWRACVGDGVGRAMRRIRGDVVGTKSLLDMLCSTSSTSWSRRAACVGLATDASQSARTQIIILDDDANVRIAEPHLRLVERANAVDVVINSHHACQVLLSACHHAQPLHNDEEEQEEPHSLHAVLQGYLCASAVMAGASDATPPSCERQQQHQQQHERRVSWLRLDEMATTCPHDRATSKHMKHADAELRVLMSAVEQAWMEAVVQVRWGSSTQAAALRGWKMLSTHEARVRGMSAWMEMERRRHPSHTLPVEVLVAGIDALCACIMDADAHSFTVFLDEALTWLRWVSGESLRSATRTAAWAGLRRLLQATPTSSSATPPTTRTSAVTTWAVLLARHHACIVADVERLMYQHVDGDEMDEELMESMLVLSVCGEVGVDVLLRSLEGLYNVRRGKCVGKDVRLVCARVLACIPFTTTQDAAVRVEALFQREGCEEELILACLEVVAVWLRAVDVKKDANNINLQQHQEQQQQHGCEDLRSVCEHEGHPNRVCAALARLADGLPPTYPVMATLFTLLVRDGGGHGATYTTQTITHSAVTEARVGAVAALGQCGGRALWPLAVALTDSSAAVRAEARTTMKKIGVEPLRQHFCRCPPHKQKEVLHGLGSARERDGGGDDAVLDALYDALST